MNKTALLAIETEHLPARFLFGALEQLKNNTENILKEHNLEYSAVNTFGTYRRLVVEIKELTAKAADIQKEVKGPPAALLKDKEGNYTKQAEGFAQKNGLKAQDLVIVETPKGPFLYAKCVVKGQETKNLLPQIFENIIRSLVFPKNMVWEDSCLHFARPIRNIVALYGDKLVKFEIAGVKSTKTSLPMLSFGAKPVKIDKPEDYIPALRNLEQPILADIEERKQTLIKALNSVASKLGYQADLDEDLINETISFTEHPVVLSGDMDIKFLKLPKELITNVFKKQLRMFPVVDNKGNLQPHFLAVRDGISVNQDEVRHGFKNVMTARLTDAVFFFENDIKTGLDKMAEKLATINFIDGLGNMAQKTKRVEELSLFIAANQPKEAKENIQKAAKYCYADLASSVVYEFSELQGYMGGVYAGKENFPKDSAVGIGEFYLPLSASSALPKTLCGAIVSLAGKLDSLSANFAAGQVPSGSQDPFALRRQAMGAVRIILDKNIAIPLNELIDKAIELLPKIENSRTAELFDFMWQRFALLLEQEQITPDVIEAIKPLKNKTLNQLVIIAKALNNAKNSQALMQAAQATKRISNILKKVEEKTFGDIKENLFSCNQEKVLYNTLKDINAQMIGQKLEQEKDYKEVFNLFSTLAGPLEDFFKEVMVNVPQIEIKNNRLALLDAIQSLLSKQIADLSKLQIK
ncbi:MAG: glycine--tRNA ligase subunit beta [Elusimicrobiaceae bacterium]|nr:glycine--tRNA ligase subunit beta [Elusimicrobiaceae bacterium]